MGYYLLLGKGGSVVMELYVREVKKLLPVLVTVY